MIQNQKDERPVLYIRTLGTLHMLLENETFTLNTALRGKIIQLFLLLVYAGENGMTRVRLQDAVYDRRKTDVSNALRIAASRLRKLLAESALPGSDYVSISKNTYFLGGGGQLNVQMDAVQMDAYYHQALLTEEPEKKRELLEEACNLYRGEFLPAMSGEDWVEALRSHYQEVYFDCVRGLCSLLKAFADYEKLLRVSSSAMEIYPMEEWACLKIDCLMSLKRYKEAMKAYDEAVRIIYTEQGMVASHHLLEQFRTISEYLQYTSGNASEIKDILKEEQWSSGAYCCTYPGFIDCFRMEVRACERGKSSGMLMICTILDGKGARVGMTEKLKGYRDILGEVIHVSLRREDVYTSYSREQMLILVNDLNTGKCMQVESRLITGFRRRCGQKAMLQIESLPLKQWVNAPGKKSIRKRK